MILSTPKDYSRAHWLEEFFFLNAHLQALLENGMYAYRTSPLGTEKYFEAHK
jgi:hypothetical protein